MLIDEQALQCWIDNFYGYGSWQARFWFVSHEESGTDIPEEVAEKLHYFCTLQNRDAATLCDIRELYRAAAFRAEGPRALKFSNLYDYRFGAGATLHGYWKNLIAFVHGYRDEKLPDLLDYQQNHFVALSARNEALIRLYPLPAHDHAWYYAWLDLPTLSFLKSRAAYQEYLYSRRIGNIMGNIITHKPEVVLMYGMENINQLKESVQQFFPAAKFKAVKGVKQQIPQHHLAEVGETIMIMTTQIPSLRHKRTETGFDWYAFGKMVRGR